ncbi:F-box domain-containing protein [Mycena sanguinolenta]|uniref:F-box domain-containing protein n=1 Tax=Mycena sanguinolenta TaxID=230812 RepID=A0A8H6Y6I5_9AGAR|nr:F-box domain-containing protein [Mycena sanguinolenta]
MLSSLAADRARVAALEAQILDLENTLSALRLEQAQAQSRLDSYKYPVLTLPTEIVTEIFLCFPPPYPSCSWLAGTRSPTSLACVCREWRNIALSIPSLWRAMNLSNNGTPLEQRAHICDLWLKRSRSCPLSIKFDARAGHDEATAMSAVMALIAPHRLRLEHLKLVIFMNTINPGAIEGSMPLLRHLDLDLKCVDFSYNTLSLRELPLLRSVVLSRTASRCAILPWAQLTSLVMNKVYLDECVPILQQTSNLIHCELLRLYDLPDYGGVTTLTCLESLVLKSMPLHQYTAECLQSFITPALRRLIISEALLGHEPIGSLTNFISKSGAKLQEVHIAGRSTVPRHSYRVALQSVPRLSFGMPNYEGKIGEGD